MSILTPVIWKDELFQVQAEIRFDSKTAVLKMIGSLNEKTRLLEALKYVSAMRSEIKHVRLELGELAMINSSGVREWLIFIGKLREKFDYSFGKLSEIFVERANIFPELVGGPEISIESFEAPYLCPKCGQRTVRELRTAELDVRARDFRPPAFECDACLCSLEFDELDSDYFNFMRREKKG